MTTATRRGFGNVRKLPSGMWQARYVDAAGSRHARSFVTKTDANVWLSAAQADLARGDWFDPSAGKETLKTYTDGWLERRLVRGRPLAPRTRERYEAVFRIHIEPALGPLPLRQVTPARVRDWHRDLTAGGMSRATAAKAYRLLHAICASAVAEERIARNPCAIPGATVEVPAERPVATLSQVYELVAALEPRDRALIMLATFSGLRFGELAGLRRHRVDLERHVVFVREDLDELDGGHLQRGRVKSSAGIRTVAIPAAIMPVLEEHLETFSERGPEGLVFVGPQGGPLRRANFRKRWVVAVGKTSLPEGFRFHDLRHTANTFAAATGASTKELMSRMGHASPRAALIYQHATRDRDRVIAVALSELVEVAERKRAENQ